MKKVFILVSFALLLFSKGIHAQENVVTNESIVEMQQGGLSDQLIIAKIKSEKVKFDTSTQSIKVLKAAGVSDDVIAAMIVKGGANKEIDDSKKIVGSYITNLEHKDDKIVITYSDGEVYNLSKGSKIHIYLPASKNDFLYVEPKSTLKMIGDMAGKVSSSAFGIFATDVGGKIGAGAYELYRKTSNIEWGADAIENINNLPISKKAKKIAGKDMEVIDWEPMANGANLTAKLDGKKYSIDLLGALITGEISLKK
ncbi:hypothetical protein EDM00_03985 [Ornithobacterium rhinotracheale]|uniref:hypothetical protein n=1 Tax=Ornithobacterium rhinotracheale TaxID=28251 RepID=UPI00129CB1E9|nr:hypothetical protein [Ornithobacterium rhinotracheale]MRI63157.1 hypothetical protein [Ornithobacterium rhinotracheale]